MAFKLNFFWKSNPENSTPDIQTAILVEMVRMLHEFSLTVNSPQEIPEKPALVHFKNRFKITKLNKLFDKSKFMEKKEQKKSMLGILSEMEVGASHSFPAAKTNSVKSMCSTFGFQWGKEFRTSLNRVQRTVDVTRIS